MSNTIESKGRSVEEAISEALLRMGLRRDEVDVTVLQQPSSGVLGLFGKKPAVVRVVKKGGAGGERRGGRGHRDDDRRQARGPREGAREGAREGVRTGETEARGERRDRDDRRGGRDDRKRGAEMRDGGREGSREGGREGSRGGRGARGADPARQGSQEPRAATASVAGTPADPAAEVRTEEGGRSSNRRRRRRPTRRRDEAPIEKLAAAEVASSLEVPAIETPAPQPPRDSMGAAEVLTESVATGPAPAPRLVDVPLAEPPAYVDAPPPAPRPALEARTGIRAVERVKPYDRPPAATVQEFLQTVTTDLMRQAGFPCRCEVREGEYDLVKLVTDDSSARVLIGRFGAAVDAIEHLVEKVATQAVGDRVKMNLDINNYRRRREEHLVHVVRQVVQQVRQTGEAVHLDPMSARERRIVHLQVEEIDGLGTCTVVDGDSKHVVVATAAAAAAMAQAETSRVGDDEPGLDSDPADDREGGDRV